MLRAAMAHPGVEIVAVNDPFVDAGGWPGCSTPICVRIQEAGWPTCHSLKWGKP